VRLGLRLAAMVRAATARVHNPLFWRLVYATLATDGAVAAAAALLRALRRVSGEGATSFLLTRLAELFVWSGWPHQSRGWVNLDASRFLARTRQRAGGARPPVAKRRGRRREGVLHVGCVGAFSGLLTMAREHFQEAPPDLEITVFDLAYRAHRADYLEGAVAAYHAFEQGPGRPGHVARAVNGADLDLLFVVRGPELPELLDRVETPCIVDLCTGSDLLHHPKIDFHVYPQPEADYFVRDGRIFCGTSRARFGDERVIQAPFLYDRRGIDPDARVPWSTREPLILFHGSLYKAASAPFLDTIYGLMEEDAELELVLMGRDDGRALDSIRAQAARVGLGGRVEYAGSFSPRRAAGGSVAEEGWSRLRGYLDRARLAPDPWPLGGAAARVEAFAAGVPSVHLAVRFDRASWGRRQHSVAEVEALRVPDATAADPDEYRRLCARCLYDESFAERIAGEQAAVCARVTDARAYWDRLVASYRRWARDRGGDR
jgi:hypothetical protein